MATPLKFQLTLTHDERQILLALIDLAVKANGLSVAGNALVLAERVKSAQPVDDTAKVAKNEDPVKL